MPVVKGEALMRGGLQSTHSRRSAGTEKRLHACSAGPCEQRAGSVLAARAASADRQLGADSAAVPVLARPAENKQTTRDHD